MVDLSAFNATGRLLQWTTDKPRGTEHWWKDLEVELKVLKAEGWSTLVLKSECPLLGEFEERESPPWEYHFLLRESSHRLLLLSTHSVLVLKLLDLCNVRWRLRSPSVLIPQLVTDITNAPTEFAIGTVWANIDAFGRSLRGITLYGDDLADSNLFREILPRIQPFRVTLRSVTLDSEVLSISSRGDVGFTFTGQGSLLRVDEVLRFLSNANYIDWGNLHSVA